MIRVALVGYGCWGMNLARNLQAAKGCHLETICDLDRTRLGLARNTHPGVAASQSWRKVAADPNIDAVVVATPADTHFEIARGMLDAGKHLLVEKPVVNHTTEAEQLVQESDRRGLTLMVDHTFVYSPAVQHVDSLLSGGMIGQVCSVEAERLNASGSRTDASVHWDLAWHDLSILQYLFRSAPHFAGASRDGSLPETTVMRVRFPSGISATVRVSWNSPEKRRKMILRGTRGTIEYRETDRQPVVRVRDEWGRVVHLAEPAGPEPLQAMICHFLDCIRYRETPVSSGKAASELIRVLSAADASLDGQGEMIPVPMESSPMVQAAEAGN